MLPLFAATLFLSSFLLFSVEPLVGKMMLPMLGGVPAVWNTCMFFFQLVLLAGYGYAHALTRKSDHRAQSAVHLLVIVAPLFFFPIAVRSGAVERLTQGAAPLAWLLGVLFVSCGVPLFALSTTNPLLQKWFARTRHRFSADPYFLYIASNLGSLGGLLAYPLLIEPRLTIDEQSCFWEWGYRAMIGLVVICGILSWRRQSETAEKIAKKNETAPSAKVIAFWVMLAFLPSSLMLGVTTFLSSDVGSLPLLWVIPLGLYLLSFILTFSPSGARTTRMTSRWMGLALLPLMIAISTEANEPAYLVIPAHLLTFFGAAIICHGALAALRPSANYLTEYYLAMTVGGVLGGAFNAMVAPLVFSTVFEYPLVLVLCALFRQSFGKASDERSPSRDLAWSLGVLLVGLAPIFLARATGTAVGKTAVFGIFVAPALLAYRAVSRPLRFTLCLVAIAVVGINIPNERGKTLYRSRSFFGTLRVARDEEGRFTHLVHGSTLHGRQSTDPRLAREPLSYYGKTGPVGEVFEAFHRREGLSRVGVVGLGTGSLACYARVGEQWTFYEIDPQVVNIARDPRYFTFMRDCAPPSATFVLGDARLQLKNAADGSFDLLLIDAFSSESIPTHLLTREALALYLRKLSPHGLLAFHISNRFLDLRPVLANLARDNGLAAVSRMDRDLSAADLRLGLDPTAWALLSREPQGLGERWRVLVPNDDKIWTDGYSSLVGIFHL